MSKQALKLWSPLVLFVLLIACQRPADQPALSNVPFLQSIEPNWADSMLMTMTLDEKLGQLIIYQPFLNDSLDYDTLLRHTKNQLLGGVHLQELSLTSYLPLIDTLQLMSRFPLFNVTQEQVSINNQFTDLTDLPTRATIEAVADDELKLTIQDYYQDQLEYLGINLHLSPHNKSLKDFGKVDNPNLNLKDTTAKKIFFGQMKHERIVSVASDFDDFYDIKQDTIGLIDSLIKPYKELAELGLSGLKVSPSIFAIDTFELLSPHFLKRYLKERADHEGLIIADWDQVKIEKLLFAGVDLLVVQNDLEAKLNKLRFLVEQGTLTLEDIHEKARKVLLAKKWMGLESRIHQIDQPMTASLMKAGFDDFEIRQMFERSITLVQNPDEVLPFRETHNQPFQLMHLGTEKMNEFEVMFSKYAGFSTKRFEADSNGVYNAFKSTGLRNSKVIFTFSELSLTQKDSAFINSVNHLSKQTEVVLLNFGDPRNCILFDTSLTIVQNYEQNKLLESLNAQLLFGALQAKGKLPISLNQNFIAGTGIDETPITRLKFTVPEEVGISAYKLVGIDAIAKSAISQGATPGCQVLVAKDGKIIYSKAFGYHDFDKKKLVQINDLYDLASITKVASTTISTMKLYEKGKVRLNHRLNKHLDIDKKSALGKLNIRQLLTHQSGLQSNMPIAKYIMHQDTTGTGCSGPFCNVQKDGYQVAVADTFFLDTKYQDSIWQEVYDLKLFKRKRYRYSDVNFNLLMKVVEDKGKMSINDFVEEKFYKPLNLDRLTYRPLDRFKKHNVVPTAKEDRFRNQKIHGYVHDESAALLGGVAGNAGLFGNAESLAPLFQMLLNEGTYGGQSFLDKKTIDLFTKKQSGVNRGLGFDKNHKKHASCSPKASSNTFGHTGFTGTCVWVDPDSGLVFIFLSNRIAPDVRNRKLFKLRTRTRIHNLVYEALGSYPEQTLPEGEALVPELVQAEIE